MKIPPETEPSDGGQHRGSPANGVCPVCGGPVIEVHCIARCLRCHTVIDTCCEGVRPVPRNVPPAEKPLAKKPPGGEPDSSV